MNDVRVAFIYSILKDFGPKSLELVRKRLIQCITICIYKTDGIISEIELYFKLVINLQSAYFN